MFHIYIITVFPYLKHCLRPVGGVFCSNIFCDMVLVDEIHCNEIWSPVPCCFLHCITHTLTLMPYPAEPFDWNTLLSNDCLDVGADGQDMLSNY